MIMWPIRMLQFKPSINLCWKYFNRIRASHNISFFSQLLVSISAVAVKPHAAVFYDVVKSSIWSSSKISRMYVIRRKIITRLNLISECETMDCDTQNKCVHNRTNFRNSHWLIWNDSIPRPRFKWWRICRCYNRKIVDSWGSSCWVFFLGYVAVQLSKQYFSWCNTRYFNWESGAPRLEPGAAGWEAQTLPLCYAAPLLLILHSTVVKFI